MASTEKELLDEQQEILQEVKEIKHEVKSPSVVGRVFLGSLTGAVLGVTWRYRRGVAGFGKRLARSAVSR